MARARGPRHFCAVGARTQVLVALLGRGGEVMREFALGGVAHVRVMRRASGAGYKSTVGARALVGGTGTAQGAAHDVPAGSAGRAQHTVLCAVRPSGGLPQGTGADVVDAVGVDGGGPRDCPLSCRARGRSVGRALQVVARGVLVPARRAHCACAVF